MLVKDTDLLVLAKSELLVVIAMILTMSLTSWQQLFSSPEYKQVCKICLQYHHDDKIFLSFTLLHACIKRVLA